jgi:hypothetical protein
MRTTRGNYTSEEDRNCRWKLLHDSVGCRGLKVSCICAGFSFPHSPSIPTTVDSFICERSRHVICRSQLSATYSFWESVCWV